MDDEAVARITSIICLSLLALAAVLTFGVGWGTNQGPGEAQANAQAKTMAMAVSACQKLPTANRATCLSNVVDGPIKVQALIYCQELGVNADQEQCLTLVAAGNDVGSGPNELRATAIVACDRIGTETGASKHQDQKAITKCIAGALSAKIPSESPTKPMVRK